MYLVDKLSTRRIAKMFGISNSTVNRRLRSLGVKIRTNREAANLAYENKSVKGRSISKIGYVKITTGEHKNKLEHRIIMEKHLGRKLKTHEHVHHIDGNKSNNKISNLELLGASEHLIKHHKERGLYKKNIKQIKKLYFNDRMSCEKIAEKLNVSPAVIRYRLKKCGYKLRHRNDYVKRIDQKGRFIKD